MPVGLQFAGESLAFSDIVRTIRKRIVERTGISISKVWIVEAPDEALPEYLAEPGFLIRVFPPDPDPMSGAGRHGYLVQRRVECFLITRNLQDAGGRDDNAVLAHLDVEDRIADALTLDPPRTQLADNLPISKLIKWVPGGRDIARRIKTNKGLCVSSLAFVVTYVPKLTVFRDSG